VEQPYLGIDCTQIIAFLKWCQGCPWSINHSISGHKLQLMSKSMKAHNNLSKNREQSSKKWKWQESQGVPQI